MKVKIRLVDMTLKLRLCQTLILISGLWLASGGAESSAKAVQIHDDRPRALTGISASESFQYKDELPLDLDAPVILRMMYRLKKASLATQDRFAKFSTDRSWQHVVDDTIDHRFWLFRFSATLHSVLPVDVPGESTPETIGRYYRCDCSARDDSGQRIRCLILSRTVPRPLTGGHAVKEPIQCTGLLYCRAVPAANQRVQTVTETADPIPVFIADRLAWFPEDLTVANAATVDLARQGFDAARLDDMAANNGRPLGKRDREAFYQLLKVNSQKSNSEASDAQSRQPVSSTVPLKSIVARSSQHLGARVALTARCRECTRVEVSDDDIRRRYDIDHYYQLSLFPDFDQPIVLTEGQGDQKKQVTFDRYPVTVCCVRLPVGRSADDFSDSQVAIEGTFFRTWKYQSAITRQASVSGTISPLVIADCPRIVPTSVWLDYLVAGAFSMMAIVVLSMFSYYRFFGGASKRPGASLVDQLPEKIDVSGID